MLPSWWLPARPLPLQILFPPVLHQQATWPALPRFVRPALTDTIHCNCAARPLSKTLYPLPYISLASAIHQAGPPPLHPSRRSSTPLTAAEHSTLLPDRPYSKGFFRRAFFTNPMASGGSMGRLAERACTPFACDTRVDLQWRSLPPRTTVSHSFRLSIITQWPPPTPCL